MQLVCRIAGIAGIAGIGGRLFSLQPGRTDFSIPGTQAGPPLPASASVHERLTSDIRFWELLAPDRPLGIAFEGQQCGASFGNPSTYHRPLAVLHLAWLSDCLRLAAVTQFRRRSLKAAPQPVVDRSAPYHS
jgi:hypothetical protein